MNVLMVVRRTSMAVPAAGQGRRHEVEMAMSHAPLAEGFFGKCLHRLRPTA